MLDEVINARLIQADGTAVCSLWIHGTGISQRVGALDYGTLVSDWNMLVRSDPAPPDGRTTCIALVCETATSEQPKSGGRPARLS